MEATCVFASLVRHAWLVAVVVEPARVVKCCHTLGVLVEECVAAGIEELHRTQVKE